MADSATPDLVSASEARRILNISEPTEYRWRRRFADFPRAVVIGTRRYYVKSELLAWIESRREAA